MTICHVTPDPRLREFVHRYWIMQDSNPDTGIVHRLIPFGAFEWLFHLGVPTCERYGAFDFRPQPRVFYTGQFLQPVFLRYSGPFKVVGVSFHPWAGDLLAADSARLFTDTTVDFQLLDYRRASSLHERLASSPPSSVGAVLDEYLLGRLSSYRGDPLVRHIVQSMRRDPGHSWPDDGSGLSRRRLEQRFGNVAGISMGAFLRKIRVHRALRQISLFPHRNMTAIGLDSGFYDQSHFIRDFKALTGLTPGHYRKTVTPLTEPVESLIPLAAPT